MDEQGILEYLNENVGEIQGAFDFDLEDDRAVIDGDMEGDPIV